MGENIDITGVSTTLDLGKLEVDIFKLCNLDRSFYIRIMKSLAPQYFESPVLGKLFDIYKKTVDNGKAPSRKLIEHFLNSEGLTSKAQPYVDDIFEGQPVDPGEKTYIEQQVVHFAKTARMYFAIDQAVGLLGKGDLDGINNVVKDALMFNLDVAKGYDLYDVDERYANLRNEKNNKISSGYNQIDDVLGGGWTKKELFCVQAPPGFGKSIFLPNFGIKALLGGMNVVHYSLEMSEDRIGMRYDAIASSIAVSQLIDHPDEIKEKYEMFKKMTKSHLKIKEFPTAMASIHDIEAHLEDLKLYNDFVPDMIIIDYGDIMKSTRNTKSTYEEQGWIFRELRGLAQKRDVIIITATQSTRDSLASDGGTADVIGMDKVADSMEKNRILDVLFAITQSRQERDDGIINLWVAKNRNGKSNVGLEFKINYKNFQVKEMNAMNKLNGNNNSDTKDIEDQLDMNVED